MMSSYDTFVDLGRGWAESRMTSTVMVRRDTGATTTDPNGFEVPVWVTIYAAVPFRLGGSNQGSTGTRAVVVGTTEMQLAIRTGHFPAGTGLLQDGDLVEVTAGENTGLVLRIVESEWQDQATARRVPVVAVQRPEEWV